MQFGVIYEKSKHGVLITEASWNYFTRSTDKESQNELIINVSLISFKYI